MTEIVGASLLAMFRVRALRRLAQAEKDGTSHSPSTSFKVVYCGEDWSGAVPGQVERPAKNGVRAIGERGVDRRRVGESNALDEVDFGSRASHLPPPNPRAVYK